MVRGRSVGFVATGADMRTYAHELGHGVFGLEHTFPEISVSTTNNLMDYGTGTHLTHEQWKIIHARKPAYSWFDSEEDGSFGNIVIGAVVGGVVDLLVQVLEVYINEDAKGVAISSVSLGTVVNGISWSSVGLSMAFGAGGNVAGIATKFKNFANTLGGKKVAKIAIDAVADFILDAAEDIIKEYVATGEVKNVAETLISSALFSGAGGLLDGVAAKIRKRFGIKEPPSPRAISIAKKIEKPAIDLQKSRLDGFKAKIPNKTYADGIVLLLSKSYNSERGFKAFNEDIDQWMGDADLVGAFQDYKYYAAFYQQIGSSAYITAINGTKEGFKAWLSSLVASCQNFNAVILKAHNAGMPQIQVDNAIAKLCTITPESTRNSINTKLGSSSYTNAQVRAFLADVNTSNPQAQALSQHIAQIDAGIVEAWIKIVRAINNVSIRTLFAQDFILLTRVKEILENPPYLAIFDHNNTQGTIRTFNSFLSAYDEMNCYTCGAANAVNSGFPKMHEILENMVDCHTKFTNTTGFTKVFYTEAFSQGNGKARDGAQHMIKGLSDGLLLVNGSRLSFTSTTVSSFDQPFGGTVSAGSEYDVFLNVNPSGVRYVEFKSYIIDSAVDEVQFLGYLNNINNLSELLYVFNAKKLTLTQAKQKMQTAFRNNVAKFFLQPNQGGLGLTKIQQLFGTNILTQQDFLDVVDTIANNPIYEFVITN